MKPQVIYFRISSISAEKAIKYYDKIMICLRQRTQLRFSLNIFLCYRMMCFMAKIFTAIMFSGFNTNTLTFLYLIIVPLEFAQNEKHLYDVLE